jgi:hypothetical protein
MQPVPVQLPTATNQSGQFLKKIDTYLFVMSASIIAVLRQQSRAEIRDRLSTQDNGAVSFQKVPEIVRQEDAEVGVLLNK